MNGQEIFRLWIFGFLLLRLKYLDSVFSNLKFFEFETILTFPWVLRISHFFSSFDDWCFSRDPFPFAVFVWVIEFLLNILHSFNFELIPWYTILICLSIPKAFNFRLVALWFGYISQTFWFYHFLFSEPKLHLELNGSFSWRHSFSGGFAWNFLSFWRLIYSQVCFNWVRNLHCRCNRKEFDLFPFLRY